MKGHKNQDLTERVDFGFIRYANCWEDAEVLLAGLQVKPGDKVLSIGSAGDNSFSLLIGDPELAVAVDVNPVQLHLIELKKAAIISFNRENVLAFLGFNDAENRMEMYQLLRELMPDESRQFWDTHPDLIKGGVVHQGKFEHYFQIFSR